MIRAARGLLNLDQDQFGDLIGVSRRTIIRIEADDPQPTNDRRIQICEAIRDALEKEGIRFVYADKSR
jgi:DNA-binding XRE family transcriptional regulator